MATFAERVRTLRLNKGLTARDMASEISIDFSAISKWERGVNTAPQDMIIKLASYFNVSTDYLLGRTDDPRPFPPDDTRTIGERWNDPSNEFLYAMYGEVQDLTDEQKEEILNYVEFLKSKAEKEKK